MISVYLRTTPAVAKAVLDWQASVSALAKESGQTVEHAMRISPANAARACANAVYHSQLVQIGTGAPAREELTDETYGLLFVELERLQRDFIVYRQRLEEAEIRGARDRERAACDLAKVVGEREALKDRLEELAPDSAP